MMHSHDIRDVSPHGLLEGEDSVVVLSTAARTVLGNERLASIRLSEVENERAGNFVRQQDRENFVAARILARCAAAMAVGCHPDDITLLQRCGNCGGAHGKPHLPRFPGVHISWSHTEAGIAVAVGRVPVGVDVESWGSAERSREIAATVLAPREYALIQEKEAHRSMSSIEGRALSASNAAFLRLWTCKESLVKLGAISLETFGENDLADVLSDPYEESYSASLKNVAGRWFLGWSDSEHGFTGAAVSTSKPSLYLIDPSHASHMAEALNA